MATMIRDCEGNEIHDGDKVRLLNRRDAREYTVKVTFDPRRGEDVVSIPECDVDPMTHEKFKTTMWVRTNL